MFSINFPTYHTYQKFISQFEIKKDSVLSSFFTQPFVAFQLKSYHFVDGFYFETLQQMKIILELRINLFTLNSFVYWNITFLHQNASVSPY